MTRAALDNSAKFSRRHMRALVVPRHFVIALLLIAMLALTSTAHAQARREPHIGYLYPAGAQRGTTVQIVVGGQFLAGESTTVYLTGQGIRAKSVSYFRTLQNLDTGQRNAILSRLTYLGKIRVFEVGNQKLVNGLPVDPLTAASANLSMVGSDTMTGELPRNFLLEDSEAKSARQLDYLRAVVTDSRRRQANPAIEELMLLEMNIDADAAVGDRELRLRVPGGLTNPLTFRVGDLPEVLEEEWNDPRPYDKRPPIQPHELPVLINGQIQPGDVDRLSFTAQAGQKIVIDVAARQLLPYVADAVPGWFQPVIAVYDQTGKELAYADDDAFNPDPRLRFEVPKTGEYQLEIHDSIYRGRDDFVYRIQIGELPAITHIFPLGVQAGTAASVQIFGWNLTQSSLALPAREPGIYRLDSTSQLLYHVDPLPGQPEQEPNDPRTASQNAGERVVALPALIDGRIQTPGDVDQFTFKASAGDVIVAKLIARRLGSPLDGVIRIVNESGKVLAWNDDYVIKRGHLHPDMGLQTHHADPYLSVKIPAAGTYRAIVSDTLRQGSERHAYRLYLGPPRPDFELIVSPSSVNAVVGQATPISVQVIRHDGFTGEIALSLAEPDWGFSLDDAVIPANCDEIRFTLAAPTRNLGIPVPIQIIGSATIAEKQVTHAAKPADDLMQAFLWRHLAPTQSMLAATQGTSSSTPPKRLGKGPIQIPAGGQVQVEFRAGLPLKLDGLVAHLDEPPAGITVKETKITRNGFVFTLHAGPQAAPGLDASLIVDLTGKANFINRNGKEAVRQIPLGYVQSIPIHVIDASK